MEEQQSTGLLGAITEAKLLSGGRGGVSGLMIVLETVVNVRREQKLYIRYDGEHYFEVKNISIAPQDRLQIEAVEVGHYRMFLDRKADFDIRLLPGQTVYVVTDPVTLEKIRKESTYC